MPNLKAIAATVILAGLAPALAGCGGDEEESSLQPREEKILAGALTDMEQFIPTDLNRQLRRDGSGFRVRSIDCTPRESTFTARCVVRGAGDRSYDVEVKVKRSDGSYTYNCPRCP